MSFHAQLRQALGNMKIAVLDDRDRVIGYLQLLSHSDPDDSELVSKFTEWRAKYRNVFLTVFEPTEDSTRTWLRKQVLSDPHKVFFKMLSADGRLVGHLAAIHHGTEVEYDNLIRGEPVDEPHFTYYAEIAFMELLFEHAGVEVIMGKVLSDNDKVLRLHERTGFRVRKTTPVTRVEADGGFKWVEDPGQTQPEHNLVEIYLTRELLTQRPGHSQ